VTVLNEVANPMTPVLQAAAVFGMNPKHTELTVIGRGASRRWGSSRTSLVSRFSCVASPARRRAAISVRGTSSKYNRREALRCVHRQDDQSRANLNDILDQVQRRCVRSEIPDRPPRMVQSRFPSATGPDIRPGTT
jgi:hypothetical protein